MPGIKLGTSRLQGQCFIHYATFPGCIVSIFYILNCSSGDFFFLSRNLSVIQEKKKFFFCHHWVSPPHTNLFTLKEPETRRQRGRHHSTEAFSQESKLGDVQGKACTLPRWAIFPALDPENRNTLEVTLALGTMLEYIWKTFHFLLDLRQLILWSSTNGLSFESLNECRKVSGWEM